MRFEPFTTRVSPATGKPYPRCQVALAGIQCERIAYSDGMCWKHYRQNAPEIFTDSELTRTTPPRSGRGAGRDEMSETIKTYSDGLRIDRVTVNNLTHYAMFGPDGKPIRAGLFPTQAEAESHAEWLQSQ